ncbi:protein of unknown function DUF201 [Dokdonia sp. 4H-3-7-5]|nr:protein of unknown function DUF201 [Dokdonia sp. 4H-3-7-5]
MQQSILIFGGSILQRSLILKCKNRGLRTIVIDPDPNALCKKEATVFEIVDGQDYEKTLAIARRESICGVITAASDKPLVMMARVAETLKLPFISEETAIISTNKFLMKELFLKNNLPCAKGVELAAAKEYLGSFPVIIKPLDNSGSRGVVLCTTMDDLRVNFVDTFKYTKKNKLLVEEFIEGKEYSIEGLHFNGNHKVIAYTEKETTPFPYNVELGHKQPANLSDDIKLEISDLLCKIGRAFNFVNCASHTEIKIQNNQIYIIETSPRLGGDFITSHLTQLSTGSDIEDYLITISQRNLPKITSDVGKSSLIKFFEFNAGLTVLEEWKSTIKDDSIVHLRVALNKGDVVPRIKNSLNRYGEVIFQGNDIYNLECNYSKLYDLMLTNLS